MSFIDDFERIQINIAIAYNTLSVLDVAKKIKCKMRLFERLVRERLAKD